LQKNELSNITILRLAGIYGDKRNSILSIHSKHITKNKSSSRMISRTHIADIIAIIREIILSSKIKNQIFNISDNNLSPTSEVNDYICKELLLVDRLSTNNDLKESRHSSFALDNKIVDNSKIKKILNYDPIFPSYKEGLQQIAKNLNLT
jgi:nucleoside-diphosphate-sugar epimerase